jgi:PAS domain-containing protein
MPFAPVGSDPSWDGPIIRVLRATMSGDELRSFRPAFEALVARIGERWTSNFSLWWGTTTTGDRTQLAIVSGWDGIAPLRRARAGLREARHDDPVAFLDRRAAGEVWRMVDQTATTLAPGDGTTLRLVRLAIRPEAEAEFMSNWTPVRARLVESGLLAVSQLGRRDGPEGPSALVVNVWRHPAMGGAPEPWNGLLGAGVPRGFLRADPAEETYPLRPTTILRLAPGGPAILIADEVGRIVDATPAASSLLAADVWDVLDRRLQDLIVEPPVPVVPGRLQGIHRFRRPEGGTVLLRVRAAGNVPVPGRHALMLVPGSDPPPSGADLEASIAASYRRENAITN